MAIQQNGVDKRAEMARALAQAGFDDVLVLDRESAESVLTPKRRELLDRIEEGAIESVRELGRDLDRDKGAVSKDLALLFDHDLIVYDREKNRKIPRTKHDTVVVEPILWLLSMATDYTYPLGEYRGQKNHIHVHAEPDLNAIEEFLVTVCYNTPPDESIEIVRIDTAHGFTHFDKLYRRGTPKEEVDFECFKRKTTCGTVGDSTPRAIATCME
jgi:predicted transcriptional regulator